MDNDAAATLFQPLFAQTGGIDSWIGPETPELVVARISELATRPLSHAQFNQLLVLSHEAGASEGFFRYYWLAAPTHPYDVTLIDGSAALSAAPTAITSIDHLRWGLMRFYTDALLFFGNVRSAYRALRSLNLDDLVVFFGERRIDTDRLRSRGPSLDLNPIAKDDRYLISEMACKSLDAGVGETNALTSAATGAFESATSTGITTVRIGELLSGSLAEEFANRQQELVFSADDVLQEEVSTREQVLEACTRVGQAFSRARGAALRNTELYLSMVEDLDVYVATSMRNREDFRSMATFCEGVFGDARLADLNIRYFDPTLSGAEGHEDKGLIECLMVKCTKVLVYCAGVRDSFGKDAEAAMALSLGKPVIFFCDEAERGRFFTDVHPLSRLIHFESGVAVGVMVATKPEQVTELLWRIFTNNMQYEVKQEKPKYLKLREKLTGCTVRLQTSDRLLRETFWNYYHQPRVFGASVPSVRRS